MKSRRAQGPFASGLPDLRYRSNRAYLANVMSSLKTSHEITIERETFDHNTSARMKELTEVATNPIVRCW